MQWQEQGEVVMERAVKGMLEWPVTLLSIKCLQKWMALMNCKLLPVWAVREVNNA